MGNEMVTTSRNGMGRGLVGMGFFARVRGSKQGFATSNIGTWVLVANDISSH